MRQYLTGSDLFAYIEMQRQLDARAVVVVEGPDDCGVIDPHVDEEVVHTIPGYGKASVVDAAVLFEHAGVARVSLVSDSDFDRQLGLASALPPNLILTEYHDLDADIFFGCPTLLTSVLANFSDRAKRQQYCGSIQKEPVECIVDIAAIIGVVRYHSVLQNLHLKMRDFPIGPLIESFEEAGSTVGAILQLAFARSERTDQPLQASTINGYVTRLTDVRPYCSGHDLMSIMACFARARWGGSAGSGVLANAFRAAVSCACWQQTRIYSDLRRWGAALGVQVWTCAL